MADTEPVVTGFYAERSSNSGEPLDTPPEVERLLIEGYRRMSPVERLRRVFELNRALETLVKARLRKQYGSELPDRELRLRLAALRLDRETMRKVFDWDPLKEGY